MNSQLSSDTREWEPVFRWVECETRFLPWHARRRQHSPLSWSLAEPRVGRYRARWCKHGVSNVPERALGLRKRSSPPAEDPGGP